MIDFFLSLSVSLGDNKLKAKADAGYLITGIYCIILRILGNFFLQLNYVFTVFVPYHACVIDGYVGDSNDNNGDVNIRWYSKSSD